MHFVEDCEGHLRNRQFKQNVKHINYIFLNHSIMLGEGKNKTSLYLKKNHIVL